jgi:glycerol-3-phosphate O-acyltransferase/dihydroxyacetone phosphate acyltransferase
MNFIYNLFRGFLWIMYVCFFRRVYYLNSERIPKKEPLIFISNHSNGMLDPILIAAMQRRPVYFWARATEFPNNPKGWLMRKLHGLPIYRKEEGVENMHKNEATFKLTRELLYKGWNSAFIAPEGNCNVQKRLIPLKKGCARLAFKMMEEQDWELDVKILPAGVNYTCHDKFRSEVYTKLGKPISVLEYRGLYEKDTVEAVNKLTEDMRVALRAQMIYVEKEDEQLVEKLLFLVRHNFERKIMPLYLSTETLFQAEQKVANYVNVLDQSAKEALESQVDNYNTLLEEKVADDYAVAKKNTRSFFLLILGFPFWLLGTILGRIPHLAAQKLKRKLVRYREFSASFAFTAAFVVWVLWGFLFMVVGAFFIGWWALLLPITMVLLQTQAYHYQDYFTEWSMLMRYKKISKEDKAALTKQRKGIECLN